MSTIGTVGRVDSQQFKPTVLSTEQVQQRVQLFTGDGIEASRSIRIDSGARIALPANDPAQFESVANFYNSASPEGQARLAQAGHNFAAAVVQSKGNLDGSTKTTAEESFRDFISVTNESNIEEATNGMLMLGLSDSQIDLKRFGDELSGNIKAKQDKREEIMDVRGMIADYPKGWTQQENADGKLVFDKDNNPVMEASFTYTDADGMKKTETLTKTQADDLLSSLESQLSTIGDMTQLMQMNLEQALQKEQQFYQIMSNIMKMMHDTAKSIIQNLK